MGFIATLTFALSAGSAGLLKLSTLSSDTRYKSLKERIKLEQEEYDTCLNCYRDYAYELVPEGKTGSPENGNAYYLKHAGAGKLYTTYACKYCGHTKVVNRSN